MDFTQARCPRCGSQLSREYSEMDFRSIEMYCLPCGYRPRPEPLKYNYKNDEHLKYTGKPLAKIKMQLEGGNNGSK